ncbi:MAG: SufE family protein [Verrucomicrobiae bacterium]|nr:SufE family protein [Verrucomicrobiae bacterium]
MLDLEKIKEAFELLDSWERYEYVIDLGKKMPMIPDALKDEAHKVPGCLSQVWLDISLDEKNRLQFRGDSDASTVKGLVAIITSLFAGKTPEEALALKPVEILNDLNLDAQISMNRQTGIASMIRTIQNFCLHQLGRSPLPMPAHT